VRILEFALKNFAAEKNKLLADGGYIAEPSR
jgi:hypothetical protein